MIAQSQSGTGKTAAFTLAMLSRVDTSKPYPQVLCLSPTFELALQTGKFVVEMAKYMPDIKIRLATKGENRKLTFLFRQCPIRFIFALFYFVSSTRHPNSGTRGDRYSW